MRRMKREEDPSQEVCTYNAADALPESSSSEEEVIIPGERRYPSRVRHRKNLSGTIPWDSIVFT